MSELFTPYIMRDMILHNRIVMAPLTRARSPKDIATELNALYYTQRATAGLIISEGTPVSRQGQGYLFNPGIFTQEQIEGWKLVTQSVHAAGGKVFAQLWHVGRVSHTSIQPDNGHPVSSSNIQAKGAMAYGYQEDGTPGFVESSQPEALTTEAAEQVIKDFAQAAENAINAGFDGVEIHAANGYLIEQFINPIINTRKDKYAADTVEGRLRFALEVVDAVSERIGSGKTAIRLSPYAQVFDMPLFTGIEETYEALSKQLEMRKLAYVHFMDHISVRINSVTTRADSDVFDKLLHRLCELLPETSVIVAGGMTKERAENLIQEGLIGLAAFGQPYIANPDLVARLKHGWPLSEPDRTTFYGGGAEGYVDYPPFLSH